jgi:hypothetical protein
MTVLEQNVKTLTVPCLFYRESKDKELKEVRIWFYCETKFRIWNEEPYKDDFLILLNGHTGHFINGKAERQLKIYYKHYENIRPIDFHSSFDGLTITTTKPRLLEEEEFLKLYRSGKCRILKEDSDGSLVSAPLTFTE